MDESCLRPARDHCLAPGRSIDGSRGGTYRRLFPELQPLEGGEGFLRALGGRGGLCDGSTAVSAGGGDAAEAAGWPFLGQFVAHDITADRSPLASHADAAALPNARRPRVDLECLYGDGPVGHPFLYDRDDLARLLLGSNDAGRPDDLPRNSQGLALISDPRNDVHLFVSQLHLAMLKLHNGLVDRLREDGVAEADLFEEARRAARWHYQWIVLHDMLPRLIGRTLADELLTDGPAFFHPEDEPFIPLEFADAAYRVPHGQVRQVYRINEQSPSAPIFPDLMGLDHVPAARVVHWSFQFDLPGRSPAQRARKVNGRLAPSLIELPRAITGEVADEPFRSLAARDLQRGHSVGLPSGEAIARRLGVEPLGPEELGLRELGWRAETPLWYYLLKEAETRAAGDRLGPVGGRIVGEVLVGIIEGDPTSHLSVDPGWQPTLPTAVPDHFTVGDLFAFVAGDGESEVAT